MKNEIARRLLSMNTDFYSAQAQSFSATRQRIQPGMARSVGDWIVTHGGYSGSQDLHLLDMGCGNGNLATGWRTRDYRDVHRG